MTNEKVFLCDQEFVMTHGYVNENKLGQHEWIFRVYFDGEYEEITFVDYFQNAKSLVLAQATRNGADKVVLSHKSISKN